MALGLQDLAGIRTVAKMTDAFQDEEHCRRFLEAMVWPGGRICPACGCRRSTALAGREVGRHSRPLLVFQPGLPAAVHRDDAHATARDEAAAANLADRGVAHPAVGQGDLLGPLGRGAGHQPANRVADGPCPAPADGARPPAGRHGGDRRVPFWRQAAAGRRPPQAGGQGPAAHGPSISAFAVFPGDRVRKAGHDDHVEDLSEAGGSTVSPLPVYTFAAVA
jgi:Transposase zinc-ribbon domain